MATPTRHFNTKFVHASWVLGGAIVLLAAGLAIPFSQSFGYDFRVIDMPLLALFVALFLVGCLFVVLPFAIRKTSALSTAPRRGKYLLGFMLVVGLLARLLMLFSEPLMEDDYQRYMWDGALTANGYNPWRWSPQVILKGESGDPGLERLAAQSGLVLERVNHPSLRTIYPPVAQLGFALAYKIEPFSLTAWRAVAMFCELISIALLLSLLKTLKRPPLWAALYWWNPLIIKELVNAGHMEVLLVPLLLGALWAAIRQVPVLVGFLLALAVGVKIWPGLLLPLFLRRFLATPKKLVVPLLLFALLVALMFWPVLLAGFDQSSGFVAYSEKWQTNSALTPMLEALMRQLLSPFMPVEGGPRLAALSVRFLIMVTLAGIAVYTAWHAPKNAQDLTAKTLLITAMMFLLSPAQLPWYAAWFLPFMVFCPFYGLMLLMPLLQLYYLSFYTAVHEITGFWNDLIVWLIWIPVWSLLLFEMTRLRAADAGVVGEAR